jgi:hypothetical protein
VFSASTPEESEGKKILAAPQLVCNSRWMRFALNVATVSRKISFLVIAFALITIRTELDAQTIQVPSEDMLEAGDFLWPKKEGAIVPYNSSPGAADEAEQKRWETERARYLKEIERKADPTAEEKERYGLLKKLSYEEFLALYLDDESPDRATNFGGGPVSVGHVGIVQIRNGRAYVIEAMWRPGVRSISYKDWLAQRRGELIWLARLKGISAARRAAVASIAESYVGKPYDFWNFNLADDSGFYCSKLAWLSIVKGVGLPPDGRESPRRLLWYSPKQFLKSKRLQFLLNPGNYGTR